MKLFNTNTIVSNDESYNVSDDANMDTKLNSWIMKWNNNQDNDGKVKIKEQSKLNEKDFIMNFLQNKRKMSLRVSHKQKRKQDGSHGIVSSNNVQK